MVLKNMYFSWLAEVEISWKTLSKKKEVFPIEIPPRAIAAADLI